MMGIGLKTKVRAHKIAMTSFKKLVLISLLISLVGQMLTMPVNAAFTPLTVEDELGGQTYTNVKKLTIKGGVIVDQTNGAIAFTTNGDITSANTIADNALVRGDGGAKGVQGSGIIIDDSDNVTGLTSINVDGTTGNTVVVDTTTFVVDSTNNRVGIGTTTPSTDLDINGTMRIRGDSPQANYILSAVDNTGLVTWTDAADLLTAGGVFLDALNDAISDKDSNLFLGNGSGLTNSGEYNTGVGILALNANTAGNGNTAMGYKAVNPNTTGNFNTGFGSYTLNSSTTGNGNIAVGYKAGYSVTNGDYNLALGYQAGDNITSGNRNIILGYNIDAQSATSSDQLNIGDTVYGSLATDDIAIGTATLDGAFTVNQTDAADIFNLQDSGTNVFTVVDGGNVGIGVAAPSNFKLEIAGNIGPSADSTYDLGSTATRWANAYFDDVTVTNTVTATNFNGTTVNSTTINNSGTINTAKLLASGSVNGNTANFTTGNITTINSTTVANSGTISTGKLLSSGTVNGATAYITGVVNGGTFDGNFTNGSILFSNASGVVSENNANFFWDRVNNRLGIGNNAPTTALDVTGTIKASAQVNGVTANFTTANISGTTNTGKLLSSGVVNGTSANFSVDANITGTVNAAKVLAAGSVNGTTANFTTGNITTVNSTTGNITTVNATTGNITTANTTTVNASGTVNGASFDGNFTNGSLLFSNASGVISQNNSKVFWDRTNDRLGIGTNTPSTDLDVNGTVRIRGGSPIVNYVLSAVDNTGLVTWTDVADILNNGGAFLNALNDAISDKNSNLFLGNGSGLTNSGEYNTGVGILALNANTSGNGNTAMGYKAVNPNTTGNFNTGFGSYTLNGSTTGNGNVAIGYQAGFAVTNGDYNLALGYQAGDNITSGNRNIILGYGVDAQSATSSDQLNIGNTIYSNMATDDVAIGTATLDGAFTVNQTDAADIFNLQDSGTNVFTVVDGGNVGIGVSAPANFKLEIAGNIGPSTDSTYDLGSNATRWANAYFDDIAVTNTVTATNFNGTTANLTTINNSGTINTAKLLASGSVNGNTANFTTGNITTINSTTVANSGTISTGKLLSSGTVNGATAYITGVVNGGTFDGNFTNGSILFSNASGVVSENNAKFFWDRTNNRLGIGTSTPSTLLDLNGNVLVSASGAVTINELSNNVDLRVEGDTDANLFFVDASADNIGIGNNNPANFKLQVTGNVGPSVDSTNDLGSSAIRWANAYVDNFNGAAASINAITSGSITNTGTIATAKLLASANVNGATANFTTGNITTVNSTTGNITTVNATTGNITTANTTTVNASGTVNGASFDGNFTNGSLLFSNASGVISQNNSKVFWDRTNDRLGIGTNTPSTDLDVNGTVRIRGGSPLVNYVLSAVDNTGLVTWTDVADILNNGGAFLNALNDAISDKNSNLFLGNGSGLTNSGEYNTGVGILALNANTSGNGNTAMGYKAVNPNTTGNFNTGFGSYTLNGSTTGNGNVALGYQAGFAVTNGDYNLVLGYTAGDNITSGNRNIILGYGVDAQSATSSDQLNIGNTIYSNMATDDVAIGTATLDGAFTVNQTDAADIFNLQDSGTNVFTVVDGGNVGIGVAAPSNFKLEIAGNIGPSADSTYDLGSNATRWANAYFDDVAVTNTVTATNFNGTTANLTTVNSVTVNNSGTINTAKLLASGSVNGNTANFTTGNITTINSTTVANSGTISTGKLLSTGTVNGATAYITGVVNGGTFDGNFTNGSILFSNASGVVSENNAKFFWDKINYRLGIGNNAPTTALDVTGTIKASAQVNGVTANFTTANISGTTNTGKLLSSGVVNGTSANFSVDANITGTVNAAKVLAAGSVNGTTANFTTGNITTVNATTGNITTANTTTVNASGTVNGASFDGSFTNGSLLFSNASGVISQNNSKVFWDRTNDRLGIGTNTPSTDLDINGTLRVRGSGTPAANFVLASVDTTGTTIWKDVADILNDGGAFLNALNDAISDKDSNLFLGNGSGLTNSGEYNTGVGILALNSNTAGNGNTAMGYKAVNPNTTGNFNTGFGAYTLNGATTGNGNIAVGYQSGFAVTNGDYNLTLGYLAGDNITTGNRNIILGYNVDASSATGSDQLNIGNTIYSNMATDDVAIGTATLDGAFTVNQTDAADIFNLQDAGSTVFTVVDGGNVGIGVAAPSNFKLEIAGNIGPSADSTYNLGSNATRWANAYFDDVAVTNTVTATNFNGTTANLTTINNSGTINTAKLLASGSVNGNTANFTTGNITTLNSTTVANSGTITTGKLLSSGTVNGATAYITGVVNGGTFDGNFTNGSILFSNASGVVSENNANFFWDRVNNRLGIGNNAPTTALDVTGTIKASAQVNGVTANFTTANISGTTNTGKLLSSGVVNGTFANFSNDANITGTVNAAKVLATGSVNGATANFTTGNITTVNSTTIANSGTISTAKLLASANVNGVTANFATGNITTVNATTGNITTANTTTVNASGTVNGANFDGNFTNGSLLFSNASGVISQNNSKVFWDRTNDRLGLGTNTPSTDLDVNGSVRIRGGSPTTNYVLSAVDNTGLVTWTDVADILNNGGAFLNALNDAISDKNSNLFLGNGSGLTNAGEYNTGVGILALNANTAGNGNTAMGYKAVNPNTTGNFNTGFGSYTLNGSTTGNGNVAVGYGAGYAVTNGDYNLTLGYAAGDNITTGNRNIILGYNVDASSATGSDQLNIGNTIYSNMATDDVAIGTATLDGAFTVNQTDAADIFNLQDSGSTVFTVVDGGNVGIGVAAPANFKLEIAGNIGPSADSTYNLGSNATRWANAYFDDVAVTNTVTATNFNGTTANLTTINNSGTINTAKLLASGSVNGNTANFTTANVSGSTNTGKLLSSGVVNGTFANFSNDANITGTVNAAKVLASGSVNGNTANFTTANISGTTNTGKLLSSGVVNGTFANFSNDANITGTVNAAKVLATGSVNGATANFTTGNITTVNSTTVANSGTISTAKLLASANVNGVTANFVTGNITTVNATTGNITTANTTTVNASGTVNGASFDGSFTNGSLLFSNASGVISQNNSKVFWDRTNDRLGIGTNTPSTDLDVNGTVRIRGGSPTTNYVLSAVDNTGLVTWTDVADILNNGGAFLNALNDAISDNDSNLFLGNGSGLTNAGEYNTGVGILALNANTSGNGNTAMGYKAVNPNTTGNFNTGFGSYTLNASTTGNGNVAVGYQAGYAVTNGDYNLTLGYAAGDNITTGNRNIILGYNIDAQSATGSDQLNIGNTIYSNLATDDVAIGNATLDGAFTVNQTDAADIFNLQDSGTTVFTVIDGGNVGIGVAAPTAALHVAGSIKASGQINGATANFTTANISGTTNTGKLLSSGVVNGTFANFSNDANITGTVNAAKVLATGSVNGVTANFTTGNITTINSTTVANSGTISTAKLLASANINGANAWISGTVNGSYFDGNFTNGSILFSNAAGVISENNAKFFWDKINYRLGIGNNAPTTALDVTGTIKASAQVNGATANFTTGNITTVNSTTVANSGTISTAKLLASANVNGVTANFTTGNITTVNATTGNITTANTTTVNASGTVNGSSFDGNFTNGSILFSNAAGVVSQNNSKVFWDRTNNRLGLGTNAPSTDLDVNGSVRIRGGSPTTNYVLSAVDNTGLVTWTDVADILNNGGAFLNALNDAISDKNSNLFLGNGSGLTNAGEYNTGVGILALNANTSGNGNTAMGYKAVNPNTTGNFNTGFGSYTLNASTTGNGNVAVGYQAGYAVTNGDYNLTLGYAAGDNITTGNRNIILGYNIDAQSATGSDQLNIGDTVYGNLATHKIGIGVAAPTTALDVLGTIKASAQVNGATANFTTGNITTLNSTTVANSGTISTAKLLASANINGANAWFSGTVNGTTFDGNFTNGSILFSNAAGVISQANSSLFWDKTNNRFGLLMTTPGTTLGVNGTVAYNPSASTNITAGGGVTVTRGIMRVQGSGGAVDITADPQIADGADGQIVILKGMSNTNTLTLDDGTGLSLTNSASFTLGAKDTISLMYDAVDDVWIEISRSNR